MAQRVLLVCDLHDDDRPGAETVTFAIDGVSFDIDVCAEHAAALRDAMAPFVGAGRRASGAGGFGAGGTRRRAPRLRPRPDPGAADRAVRRRALTVPGWPPGCRSGHRGVAGKGDARRLESHPGHSGCPWCPGPGFSSNVTGST